MFGGAPEYFFDNCVECMNCSIEQLGNALGQFLNTIQFDTGAPVPQVDLVTHSMGGLIARAYLAGFQPNGSLIPPTPAKVRKLVFVGTPHFGSFLAANYYGVAGSLIGTQALEMLPGSLFLWELSTWNQGTDDLRGVDALAIIGNEGTWPNSSGSPGLSDGVVSITSASLNFARDPSRTRILNHCHIESSSDTILSEIDCGGDAIANAADTIDAVLAFLTDDTTGWTIGTTLSSYPYGGVVVAVENTTQYVNDVSQVEFSGTTLTQNPQYDLFWGDFRPAGQGTVQFTSASLGSLQATRTLPSGTYAPFRLKTGPFISSVSPVQQNTTALIVTSGGTITVTGYGFGQQCPSCEILLSGGALQVFSWTDSAISAYLPTFTGAATVTVRASTGSDSLNIMAAPKPALTISKGHTGNFDQGQSNVTYTVTVSNTAGAGPTAGTVTMSESAPTGLSLVSMNGGGTWNCSVLPTCATSAVLNGGSSYPAITVTMNVTGNAPASLTNYVNVSGGGSATASRSDPTTINPALMVSGPASLPVGTVNVAYTPTTVTAMGGSGDYTWTATGLAAGLSIGPATGSISGTPALAISAPSVITVQVSVTDANSVTASRSYTMTIYPDACDVSLEGTVNVADVQATINKALGVSPATADLNGDGVVNVADVQIVINAALGLGCSRF
jgi:uncharacterized repeat protein (TIGR01451 family)